MVSGLEDLHCIIIITQVLWRLARFCYKTGKYHTKDQAEKKRLAEQGWAYVERALALGGDKSNGCRRWAGILLSWSSEFEGTKKKIEKSFEIKEHFEVRSYTDTLSRETCCVYYIVNRTSKRA